MMNIIDIWFIGSFVVVGCMFGWAILKWCMEPYVWASRVVIDAVRRWAARL